ncbi:hypothetical protein [uncultured Parasutterella sp.]|uniref:hypothetical protein n=1 Tax=uncultured Parasutterella sp. TaxID=1263098 RepID=UPI00272CD13A|nr:hypothetical protein [uncultured Parasutterella sp.]
MIFSFCVYQVVSKTEFYPEPFYEEVYPETIYFDVDASDAKTAVTAAADFLVNLQLECDEKYFALLDKHNIRYRKREEIIERRPFFYHSSSLCRRFETKTSPFRTTAQGLHSNKGTSRYT